MSLYKDSYKRFPIKDIILEKSIAPFAYLSLYGGNSHDLCIAFTV